MKKNIVCPYCFEEFNRSEVMYRCSNNYGCVDKDDLAMGKFWGETCKAKPVIIPKKSLFGGMPKSGKCKCGAESTKTICPHCHNELPREMVEKGGIIISIIGARNSGKTNYITTLINELTHKGHLLNIGIYATVVGRKPDERTAERYIEDFFNKLYKNKECHSQTDPKNPRNKIPLIYKLFSTNTYDQAYLVFYDTAGENFTKPEAIADKAKFLRNSDGIILLLDTFDIPDVYERLQSKVPIEEREGRYDLIMSNIIEHFDNQLNNRDFYKKPLALTFSKIDAILKNDDLFTDARLPNINITTNSSFLDGSGYSPDDVESMNTGIQGGLISWGERQFIDNINAPVHFNGKAKFFGISALGNMPSVDNYIEKPEPYRVTDPLIWILYKLNFPLPVKKSK
jgi:hypothetical protein